MTEYRPIPTDTDDHATLWRTTGGGLYGPIGVESVRVKVTEKMVVMAGITRNYVTRGQRIGTRDRRPDVVALLGGDRLYLSRNAALTARANDAQDAIRNAQDRIETLREIVAQANTLIGEAITLAGQEEATP